MVSSSSLKCDIEYNELILSYKDAKDKEHRYHLTKIEECWANQDDVVLKDWVKLKKL